jgi:hypothetical protein
MYETALGIGPGRNLPGENAGMARQVLE